MRDVRITRIENQKQRPDRKNIYADGKFIAGVSTETLLKLALRTGDEIGPEQLRALQAAETQQGARNTAVRFLASRPRTEREVRAKLRAKEFSDEEISSAIQDLRRSGLLNDRELARMVIRDSRSLHPSGAALLRRKLAQLGVDRKLAEEVLSEELTPEDQMASARTLAAHFVARARTTLRNEPAEKLRARLAGFLGRRGFPWETIREVLREILTKDE